MRIPLAERTATAVGAALTAETLATAGTAVRTTGCRYTSNRKGNCNSWDPRKANGSNNIYRPQQSVATTEAEGLLLDTSNSRDFRIPCLKKQPCI